MLNSQIKVFVRDVKYVRIEIEGLETKIILPIDNQVKVEDLINKYKNWLFRKYQYFQEISEIAKNLKLVENKNFEKDILNYIKEFERILKVKPKGVSFRKMKRRFASCTPDNRLIFNKQLKFLPQELLRYVVCHEMCHLIVRNHKKTFWRLFNLFYQNHSYYQKLLNSFLLILNKGNNLREQIVDKINILGNIRYD